MKRKSKSEMDESNKIIASMAQLVAQMTFDHGVLGSNPSGGTKGR